MIAQKDTQCTACPNIIPKGDHFYQSMGYDEIYCAECWDKVWGDEEANLKM
jgi:hypothetical protein